MNVFLLAGQSNAHGWQSNPADLIPANRHYRDSPHPGALLAYRQRNLATPTDTVGLLAMLAPQSGGFAGKFNGFGPELSAGKILATHQDGIVALSKFAMGGAGLNTNFKKVNPTDPNPGHHLYAKMLAHFLSTLTEIEQRGFIPDIRAMFWLQGESDTDVAAGLYGQNMEQLIADLRADLRVPDMKVFVTEINGHMPVLRDNPGQAEGTATLNAALETLTTKDPRVHIVRTMDMREGFADGIHYEANQTIEIGQRWAGAYLATIS